MKGEKREKLDINNDLYIGFAESKVIAINPDLQELVKLGLRKEEGSEEPEYVKEKDGIDTVRIDVWFEEVKSKYKFKKSFFLENTNVEQKPKEDFTEEELEAFVPKTQFINQVGDTQWVTDEKELPQRFLKFTKKDKQTGEVEVYGDKEYRVAKVGEADLMAFVKNWLDFNFYKASTDILLDLKKLFKGKYDELQEHVNTEMALNTVELLEVKTVDSEDGVKHYQSVWKTSLPGYMIKLIRNVKFSDANLAKWEKEKYHKDDNPKGRYLKEYEKLALEVTGNWGSKNYFELVPFKKYDEELNPVASENTINETEKVSPVSSDF